MPSSMTLAFCRAAPEEALTTADAQPLAEIRCALRKRAREASEAAGPVAAAALSEAAAALGALAAGRPPPSPPPLRGVAPGRQRYEMPSQDAAVNHPEPFLQRLHDLLRRLTPDARREAIAQRLTEAQRTRLERWMLAGRRGLPQGRRLVAAPVLAAMPRLSERSLCRRVIRGGRCGYRPSVHLGCGLYAQASFSYDVAVAAGALGTLLAARALCGEAAAAEASVVEASGLLVSSAGVANVAGAAPLRPRFEERVKAAVGEALRCSAPPRPTLYFRTRLGLARGRELSSPTHRDLAVALLDWRRLRDAAGGRRGGGVGQAEQRATRLCGTWARLWAARGRPRSPVPLAGKPIPPVTRLEPPAVAHMVSESSSSGSSRCGSSDASTHCITPITLLQATPHAGDLPADDKAREARLFRQLEWLLAREEKRQRPRRLRSGEAGLSRARRRTSQAPEATSDPG